VPAFRVAVLISGTGTNLQALLDTVHGEAIAAESETSSAPGEPASQTPGATGGVPSRGTIEIAGVASSRAGAPGLQRAERAGVQTAVFAIADHPDRAARDKALGDWLESLDVDLVVLAGFMELLGPELIRRFPNRIVNVHPSLLPAFRGVGAIEQALEHGVRVTGVTVHYVDEHLDNGPVILQEALELSYPAHIAEIEQRVHGIEHRLLPRAVRLIAAGRVRLDPGNPRVVLVDDVD
jgi:phosphoribosylglycinamide formyltransferase-1